MSDLWVCVRCKSRDWPEKSMPGSFAVEAVLALPALAVFLLVSWWLGLVAAIPALAYSLRRYATRDRRCPICKSQEVVPLDSPRGKELLRESKTASA